MQLVILIKPDLRTVFTLIPSASATVEKLMTCAMFKIELRTH